MAKENTTKKPSAYDIELAKAFKQVKEFKKLCEANIVSLLWKTPELFFSNEKLELDDFDENMWKVYFEIAKDIIIKENKVLDEITVNFYLEKHKKLEKKYSEYGGYDGISSTYAHLKEENMDGYVEELRKWQAVIKMLKKRFPVAHRISEFVDMSASEIYEEHEAILNDVFINVDEKVKTYSITDGLDELIDKLDQGIEVGLPLDNLPMLTKEIGGFRDGEILLVSGVSGVGKAQPISEPVLTPDGFKPMGEVNVGDFVTTANGGKTRVTNVFPQGLKDVYEVSFSDGTSTRCESEHLWKVSTCKQIENNRKDGGDRHFVKPLKDIIKDYESVHTVKSGKHIGQVKKKRKYEIPVCEAVEYSILEEELPLNPYLLGLILGDGGVTRRTLTFTNAEEDILNDFLKLISQLGHTYKIEDKIGCKRVVVNNDKHTTLRNKIKELGLYGCDSRRKFIPREYMVASIDDRIKILSGLLNTDGNIEKDKNHSSSISYSTYSKSLKNGVIELARSLGLIATESEYNRTSETSTDKYEEEIEFRVRILGDLSILNLSKKHLKKYTPRKTKYSKKIVDIKLVGKEECQCIMVEDLSHLYITKDFIVTHNSTLLRNTLIPSCIKFDEKVLFMLNEENLKKFQSELLVWVANNVYKEDLQKYTVRDGNYSDEDKELLRKCAKWIKDKVSKRIITIVPLTNYTTAKAVKIVKKYCSLGITKFVLDTFKADSDIGNRKPHEVMPMKMVEIFDTVKEESKNVHISIILQLTKASTKKRYLTNDDIGMFKNVVDPVAVSIMARAMFEDEYEGGVNELKVYHMGGSSGKSKIQTKIHKGRHYQIIFITKNRNGASQDKQIVIEHDLGKNTIKEVGFCYCPVDW